MSYSQIQYQLENKYAKQHKFKVMKEYLGKVPELDSIIEEIENYLRATHDFTYITNGVTKQRNDLIEAIEVLRHENIESIVYNLFFKLWSMDTREVNVQLLAGMIISRLDMSSLYRKTVAANIILERFARCKYVQLDTTYGERLTYKCIVSLPDDLSHMLDEMGYILPSVSKPLEVTDNNEIGYITVKSSLILGGKNHDKPQNYSHINECNAVEYQYEHRLGLITEPVFNTEPKVKKNGQFEDMNDISARYKSFKHVTDALPIAVGHITRRTDVFYLTHAYDTRGRTYVKAYEFNYQGIGYLKAMINLNEKELIKEEW